MHAKRHVFAEELFLKNKENDRFKEVLREIAFCSKLAVPLKPFDMLGKNLHFKNVVVLVV